MEQHDQKDAAAAAFRVCSWIALWINLLLTVFLTYNMVRSRSGFLKIFADFGTAIPALTILVLSRWFLAILPVLAIVGIVKEWLLRSPLLTLIWNGVQLAAALVVWELFVTGIHQPLIQLIEKLSGGG